MPYVREMLYILIISFYIIKPTRCTNFSNLFLGIKLYRFWTVPLSIIRSFSLYTQKWCISYSSQAGSKPVWRIPLLCLEWKAPDDGERKCPKHVEFYSKNKFEKLVHLVGFIIRIYHDARSPERQKRNKEIPSVSSVYGTLYIQVVAVSC